MNPKPMFDKAFLAGLAQAQAQWEESVLQQSLARLPERAEKFMTTSSEPVNRLYTPLNIAGMDYLQEVGLPGAYPFTRWRVEGQTSDHRLLQVGSTTWFGNFYNGRLTQWQNYVKALTRRR